MCTGTGKGAGEASGSDAVRAVAVGPPAPRTRTDGVVVFRSARVFMDRSRTRAPPATTRRYRHLFFQDNVPPTPVRAVCVIPPSLAAALRDPTHSTGHPVALPHLGCTRTRPC